MGFLGCLRGGTGKVTAPLPPLPPLPRQHPRHIRGDEFVADIAPADALRQERGDKIPPTGSVNRTSLTTPALSNDFGRTFPSTPESAFVRCVPGSGVDDHGSSVIFRSASVRPKHLFDQNFDHDCFFELPSQGVGCPFICSRVYFTLCPVPSCPTYEPNSGSFLQGYQPIPLESKRPALLCKPSLQHNTAFQFGEGCAYIRVVEWRRYFARALIKWNHFCSRAH